MNNNQEEHVVDHYVVEPVAPKWVGTALTTVGAALVTALLVWIATSQLDINTQMAVVLYKLESQEELIEQNIKDVDDELDILLDNQNRIWPRLRAHGENIQVLAQILEKHCDCKIELKDPEPF